MLVHGPWNPAVPERNAWPEGTLSPADEARFADYADALAFFEGDQWPEGARRGDPPQMVFNYARVLIRKTASYVFPGPVGVSVTPDGTSHAVANRAERRLTELRDALDLTRLDLALTIDSAVLGDAALKVTWDHDAAAPRVVAVDPGTLVVRWAPDNPHAIEEVTQGYALTGLQVARMFPRGAPPDLDEGRRYPVIERWTAERWRVLIAGQLVHEMPNPYGWIPYLILANDPRPLSFWGSSDLLDLMDICRELNRRMSVLSHVLELSGAPIAVLENVDGSEGIRVGPGAKWELPEGSRAYLLDLLQGGGAETHLRYVDVLFRMLHDLAETPRTAFGDSGRDLSGAALEVEIQPLVQKVGRKRRMWDGLFAARNAMLLDLLERFGGEDFQGLRQTTTLWPPVLPSDTESAVRSAVSLVGSGIQSRRSAMASLGEADPDGELARIREETGTGSEQRFQEASRVIPSDAEESLS
jgi:hypothetical protein